MRRIYVLTLCISLTAVSQSAQIAEKGLPLTVQVVDALTGKPRADADLFLQDLKWRDVAGPLKPDRFGKAEFQVEPGNYILRAEARALNVYYGQLPDGMVQTIVIKAGGQPKSVLFVLSTPAVLSGYVRDELGDPVQNVQVHLIRPYWNDGSIAFQPAFSAQSDDRGYYRIAGARPGAYIVCAIPPQNLKAPEIGPLDFSLKPRPLYYQRACTPGEPVSTSPPMLRISAAQQANIDLSLASAPTVTVRGRVNGDFENIFLHLVSESLLRNVGPEPTSYAQSNRAEFVFTAVVPGRYRLEGEGQKRVEKDRTEAVFASIPIEVGGTDIEGLEVTLEPAAALDMAFEESEPGQAEGVAAIGLMSVKYPGSTIFTQGTKDKVRRFQPLRSGEYWLYTRTSNPKICITGARLGDRDAFRQPMLVTAGLNARLTVTLSSHCAVMSGRILAAGKPTPGSRVVVLLRGTPENPGDSFVAFADPDGDFELSGIAPGRYLVWAWPDDDSGQPTGPPNLASVAQFVTVVEAREGEPVKVQINVLDWKERAK